MAYLQNLASIPLNIQTCAKGGWFNGAKANNGGTFDTKCCQVLDITGMYYDIPKTSDCPLTAGTCKFLEKIPSLFALHENMCCAQFNGLTSCKAPPTNPAPPVKGANGCAITKIEAAA